MEPYFSPNTRMNSKFIKDSTVGRWTIQRRQEEKMSQFLYNLDVGKPKQDTKFRCDKEKIDKFDPIKILKETFCMHKKKTL